MTSSSRERAERILARVKQFFSSTETTDVSADDNLWGYWCAASVVEAFDPAMLKPCNGSDSRSARMTAMETLKHFCVPPRFDEPTSFLSLQASKRVQGLERLGTADKIQDALDQNRTYLGVF